MLPTAGPMTEPRSLPWHATPADAVMADLGVDPDRGLTSAEVTSRLDRYGPNRLPEAHRRGPWARLGAQFNNPLILVLIVAGVVTALLEHYLDAAVIFGVVVINAVIGFVQEGKAEGALEAVRAMLATRATVLREGQRHEVDATGLVPGDLVLLESGDRVPADLRLIREHNLRVEESALTGESVPAEKSVEPVDPESGIGDRACVAFSGTLVVYGQARGVVVATGAQTEVGRIGAMVAGPGPSTPLTKRLDQFARQITGFILMAGLRRVPVRLPAGWAGRVGGVPRRRRPGRGRDPEGLPAIITIVLAIGTRAMAADRAIVRRLPAVETLGSVTVICSDKTGTLTRNEMTAVRILLPEVSWPSPGSGYAPEGGITDAGQGVDVADRGDVQQLAIAALLCNDAALAHDDTGTWSVVGDPTEGALVTLALKAGLDPGRGGRPDAARGRDPVRVRAPLHGDPASRPPRACVRDPQGCPGAGPGDVRVDR